MSLTINHSTNDISATSGSTTIDGKPVSSNMVLLDSYAGNGAAYIYDIPSGTPPTSYFLEFRRPSSSLLSYPVALRFRSGGSAIIPASSVYYTKYIYSTATTATTSFPNGRSNTTSGISLAQAAYSSFHHINVVMNTANAQLCRVSSVAWDVNPTSQVMQQFYGGLDLAVAVDGFEIYMSVSSRNFEVSLYSIVQ